MVKSKVFLKFVTSYAAILMLPIIFISVLIFTSFVNNLKIEIMNTTSRMLLQVSDNIDINLQNLRNISGQITLNPNIAPLILSQNKDQVSISTFYQCIRELHNYKIADSIIDNIFIVFGDSNLVISDVSKYNYNNFFSRVYIQKGNKDQQFQNQMTNLKTPIVLNTQQVYSEGLTSNVISYIQPLPIGDLNYSTNLIVTIKESVIRKMIQKVLGEYSGYVYVLDPNNNIIVNINSDNSLDKNLIESEKIKSFVNSFNYRGITTYKADGKDFIISNVKSANTGWRYITAIESKQILKNVNHIKGIYTIIIMTLLLIGLLLAYYFSKGNYNNVKKIIDMIHINNNNVNKREYINEWYLINNAVKKYISENTSLQNKLTDMMPIMRNNFFVHLLKGDIKDANIIQAMVDSFEIKVEYGKFAVILIAIDSFEQLECNSSKPTQGVIKITLANIAEEFCKKIGCGYAVELDSDKIAVIISLKKTEDDSYNEILKEVAKDVYTFIKENFKLGTTVAISKTYNEICETSNANIEAKKALDYRIIKGDNSIICFNELEDRKCNGYRYSFDQESKIVNLLRLGDSDKIKVILSDIVNTLKKEPVSLDIVMCTYYEIVNTAIKSLSELGIDINVDEYLHEILSRKNIDEVYIEVCNLYVKMCDKVRLSKYYKNIDLRDKIIMYLAENYMNKDLSEDIVACKFDVSLSFMSRFFKDQVGFCFIDSLHNLRLSKAKELLTFSRKSLGGISDEIGYNSVYNFNRVFKRYENISPTEYRVSMNGHQKEVTT